ncbi:hypothetical protein BDZ91DRAFT_709385 [Kalaharituber pfeilii]|nr:hypothetical protein BDZ91DRAFT_709385 [Kalaharituber pfeilii]
MMIPRLLISRGVLPVVALSQRSLLAPSPVLLRRVTGAVSGRVLPPAVRLYASKSIDKRDHDKKDKGKSKKEKKQKKDDNSGKHKASKEEKHKPSSGKVDKEARELKEEKDDKLLKERKDDQPSKKEKEKEERRDKERAVGSLAEMDKQAELAAAGRSAAPVVTAVDASGVTAPEVETAEVEGKEEQVTRESKGPAVVEITSKSSTGVEATDTGLEAARETAKETAKLKQTLSEIAPMEQATPGLITTVGAATRPVGPDAADPSLKAPGIEATSVSTTPLANATGTAEPAESAVEAESALQNEPAPSKPAPSATPRVPASRKAEADHEAVPTPLKPEESEQLEAAAEDQIELPRRSGVDKEVKQEQQQRQEPEEPYYVADFSKPPDYYNLILTNGIIYANPQHLSAAANRALSGATPQPSTQSPPPEASSNTPQSKSKAFPTTTTGPKQTITFASTRLNWPVTRLRKKKLLQAIAEGEARVPPKPEEPDNCCMSGCVNCVWDVYREELEYYTQQKFLAQQLQQSLSEQQSQSIVTLPSTSMDDDGMGVAVDESAWLDNEDIPVGIRVFMATEKRLREKKRKKANGVDVPAVGQEEEEKEGHAML